jgi:uncharacterized protein (DUF2236 family)
VPLPKPLDQPFIALNATLLRREWHPRVQFADPSGDPGWFGPDSAMWYVHGHSWALTVGLFAAAAIETLHPDFAWMGTEHSNVYKIVDGVKSKERDMDLVLRRFSRSFSFFTSTAFGPSEVAARETRLVKSMHQRVKGNRPDGKPYDAMDPATLRWAHNTVVWGIARAHELYHPRPLQGADLDRYYAEYARIGEALGGTDLPATKAQVDEELAASFPLLGVTAPSLSFYESFEPSRYPLAARPLVGQLRWAVLDILPDYARRLLRAGPRSNPAVTRLRRGVTRGLVNGLEMAAGHLPELRQAQERVTSQPAETDPALVAASA